MRKKRSKRDTPMTRTLTTLALLASTIPALADGKTDTLAVVNVTIAKSECGLEPQDWARTSAANSLQFTGLSQKDWVNAVADMATIRAEQMYADRSIGRFCADMARIYGGVR